jgi:hypothetical protein
MECIAVGRACEPDQCVRPAPRCAALSPVLADFVAKVGFDVALMARQESGFDLTSSRLPTIARLAETVSAWGTTMMANDLNIQFYDKHGGTRIRIRPLGASRNVASPPLGTSFDRTINHPRHGPDVGIILCNIS